MGLRVIARASRRERATVSPRCQVSSNYRANFDLHRAARMSGLGGHDACLCFLYGPRGPSFGAAASTSAAISSRLQSRSLTPAAIAGSCRPRRRPRRSSNASCQEASRAKAGCCGSILKASILPTRSRAARPKENRPGQARCRPPAGARRARPRPACGRAPGSAAGRRSPLQPCPAA